MNKKTSCTRDFITVIVVAFILGFITGKGSASNENTQPIVTVLVDPTSTPQIASKEVVNAHITQNDGVLSPVPYAQVPTIVREVLSKEDTVVKSFLVFGGLTAWVVHSSDHPSDAVVLYTMDDDRLLVHGRVFSMKNDVKEQGRLVEHGAEYAQRYKPVIDLDAQWNDIANSYWFADGTPDDKATRIVYGFFDANCIYCHLAWLALEPYMEKGLQVRWMPVAIIGQDSDAKAAAIVQAPVTSNAMRAGHSQWEQGGFPVAEVVPDAIRDGLDANLLLMRSLGVKGTPAFFYKDAKGRVQSVGGMPSLSQAAKMAGMAEIENSNPKLQRFR